MLLVSLSSLSLAYKDLVDRQEMRQEAWSVPGWDECVMRTGVWVCACGCGCVCVCVCEYSEILSLQ